MHILYVNVLKLLFGFFWLFLGQGLAFFGEDRLATLVLISRFAEQKNRKLDCSV